MKRMIFLIFVSLSICSYAQTDTIFRMNGEINLVNVTEITESTIKFVYLGESFSNSIPKGEVYKIHFKSGRIQEFSSSLNFKSVKSCLDWENVQISNIESEVKGLKKIDIVGAKAKGMTTMSSLAKLQDRAYNKIKISTAMLGGNIAYILDQNIEEGSSGYYSSKSPGVTISAIAYTTKKTKKEEIISGEYSITYIYSLKANAYEIENYYLKPQKLTIDKSKLFQENNFLKINLNISSIQKVKEFTIIYADSSEIILSGLYSTKNGKKTYYNIFLKK